MKPPKNHLLKNSFWAHLENLEGQSPYVLLALTRVPEGTDPKELLSLIRSHFRGMDFVESLGSSYLLLLAGVTNPSIADPLLQRLQHLIQQHTRSSAPPPLGGLLLQQIPRSPDVLWLWLLRALQEASQHLDARALIHPYKETQNLVKTLPVPAESYETLLHEIQPGGGILWISGGDAFSRNALLWRLFYEKQNLGFESLLIPGISHRHTPLYPLLYPLGTIQRLPSSVIRELLGQTLFLFSTLLQRYHPQMEPLPPAPPPTHADALVFGARDLLQVLAQRLPTLWIIPEVQESDLETLNLLRLLMPNSLPGLTILITGSPPFPMPPKVHKVVLPQDSGPHSPLIQWLQQRWSLHNPKVPPAANLPDLLEQILHRLSPLAREAVYRLAILQGPITAQEMATCLQVDPLEAKEALNLLKGYGLILEHLGTSFFLAPELPSALLQRLEPAVRQSLYRKIYRCVLNHQPSLFSQLWAAELAEAAGEPLEAFQQWVELAETLFQVYTWRSGFRALLRALEIQKRHQIPTKLPLFSLPLESVLFYRYVFDPQDPTRKVVEATARHLRDLGYQEEWIALEDWLAFQDLQQGQYGEAEHRARSIEKAAQQSPRLKGVALRLLGACAWYQEQWEDARKYWHQALKHLQNLTPHQRARLLGNIGMLYEREENFDKALRFYQAAMEVFTQEHFLTGLATGSGMMGRVEFLRGNLGRALELLERALYYARKYRNEVDEALWSMEMVIAYRYLGAYTEARTLAQQALQLFQKQQNTFHIMLVTEHLAEIALLEGREEEGFQAMLQALDLARQTQIPDAPKQVLFSWSLALLTLGKGAEVRKIQQRFGIALPRMLTIFLQALEMTPQRYPEFKRTWDSLHKSRDALSQIRNQRFLLEAMMRAKRPEFPAVLRETYRALLELAQTLENPNLRQLFLTRNPNAARIRALALQRGGNQDSPSAPWRP